MAKGWSGSPRHTETTGAGPRPGAAIGPNAAPGKAGLRVKPMIAGQVTMSDGRGAKVKAPGMKSGQGE